MSRSQSFPTPKASERSIRRKQKQIVAKLETPKAIVFLKTVLKPFFN
jgi:hypothetical protein